MFRKGIPAVVLCVLLSALFSNVAFAKTPDGETPANEGVCDDTLFATPGLYGLCVAFCEAQDCEATLNPSTGEIEFAENCKASSSKILSNYNRRKTDFDPSMPCVNEAANECPCWTEDELDQVGDGFTVFCGQPGVGSELTFLIGLDDGVGGLDHVQVPDAGNECFYHEQNPQPTTTRLINTPGEEAEVCRQSILTECADRGL
jgi:hypothetical protein